MNTLHLLAAITIDLSWELAGITVTVVTLILSLVFAFGKFSGRMSSVENSVADMQKDIKEISTSVNTLVGKVSVIVKDSIADDLSVSKSPRQLNETGLKVLKDSSIEQVIEPKFDFIIDQLKKKKPQNPYQAQEALFEIVQSFKEDDGLLPAIENGAFLSGRSPEEVLYVGALNIRDKVIEKLGLEVGDIDKHDPIKKK